MIDNSNWNVSVKGLNNSLTITDQELLLQYQKGTGPQVTPVKLKLFAGKGHYAFFAYVDDSEGKISTADTTSGKLF